MGKFKSIILSVPHARVDMPTENGWEKCEKDRLFSYIEDMADMDVDKIFRPVVGEEYDITLFTFPYSRFYCDVERLENDPMKEKGQGIIYSFFKECKREVTDEMKKRLYKLRYDYLGKISNILLKKENVLLIDCHSFTPTEKSKDIDVCIGFNEDWSKPDEETLKLIEDTFKEFGYRVAYNKPFSNSLTPVVTKTYKSVMIELNKSIYMHKDFKTLQSDFYKVNNVMNIIYERLLNFC